MAHDQAAIAARPGGPSSAGTWPSSPSGRAAGAVALATPPP